MILSVVLHNSYRSCSKCDVIGVYAVSEKSRSSRGRVVYNEIGSCRTHESFINQTDVDYHTGISSLINLRINIVDDVVLDYMHLVLLGVSYF